MSADILTFPINGWCVRAGTSKAHYLTFKRGRMESACGAVERFELYRPLQLAPKQRNKLRCQACEAHLLPRRRTLGAA